MLTPDILIATGVGYVGLLFLIAYAGDRRARGSTGGLLRSPFVYTLAISVYCTSWTFYGAVGSAARNGLEYLAIYIGPTCVFVGWWFVLRKLVRIGRSQRITSVADLLSSRYGKSNRLAVLVTIIAVVGIAPYIALQLKAVTSSIQAIAVAAPERAALGGVDENGLALGVAAAMALFTILFGTRNVDAKEQHHGVVAAIAFEALVKLAALLAVGGFVVYAGGGLEAIFSRAEAAGVDIYADDTFSGRWIATTLLAMAAVICLPRQFQITVVEAADENHLRVAGWAFPAYLMLMSLFTLPIALHGLVSLPGSNPDMFVLTLPLAGGQQGLALFAFIGGFSSATSMIIVESIALSIMVSNHIIMPILLRTPVDGAGRDVTQLLLNSRRASIVFILSLGFFYFYLTRNSDALAPIGLISFAGVAQFLPAILAALFWREATVTAAIAAVGIGFVTWAWTLFLPSFEGSSAAVAALMAEGPWGIGALRPEALFGLQGFDPLVHSVFWSLFLNTTVLVGVSLVTRQSPLERLQATLFADAFRRSSQSDPNFIRGSATANDLFFVAQRVLGGDRALALFDAEARQHGVSRTTLEPAPDFIGRLERELAGVIGAASAHVMLSKVVAGGEVSFEEVMQMAGETRQAIAYSQELEQTSQELRSTAAQLANANAQLRALDQQKDEFLSQVSHEVRTPMTSIRSFSEILLDPAPLSPDQQHRFVSTIHTESVRLTRLLDEILDLSALERNERVWENQVMEAGEAIAAALDVCEALARQRRITLVRHASTTPITILGQPDRLRQVVINLVSNAIKYNEAAEPRVEVTWRSSGNALVCDIRDNGPGIAEADQQRLFDKFSRGQRQLARGEPGAGLGLAISRQIVAHMKGSLDLMPGSEPGAWFRISIPLASATP